MLRMGRFIYVFLLSMALLDMPALGGCDQGLYKDWMEKGKNFNNQGALDLAVNCFDKAIEFSSSCIYNEEELADAYGRKGWTLFQLGQFVAAIGSYDKALSYKEVDWIWEGRGQALVGLKKYGEAVNSYDEAIAINPVSARIWYHKGIALGEMGKYAEAIDALDNALNIDPTYSEVWLRKGMIYEKWGKNQSALEAYDKENENNPESMALSQKANLLIKMGQYDEALDSISKCIELNPDSTSLWRMKGDIFDIQGKYTQAIEAYNESIRIDINDSLAWYKKGNDLYNLSRYEGALQSYEKVIEIGMMRIKNLEKQEDAIGIESAKERWEKHVETALDGKNKTLAALGNNPPMDVSIQDLDPK